MRALPGERPVTRLNLSSRQAAPFALWLVTGPRPATTFNGHDVAAFDGFSDADAATLWNVVKDAWKFWQVDIVAGDEPTKPHVGIGFCTAINGYPGGGQANVGSWQSDGIQAWVFVDRLQFNPTWCGLDAVHESGHVAGGFTDMMTLVGGAYQYTPNFFMGFPLPNPVWTPEQKAVLDLRFGAAADLNFDGKVDFNDARMLQGSNPTGAEAVAVVRGMGRPAN